MSSETDGCLALWLEGPLQSWGVDDRFSRRKTLILPSKSGILGLCCAALGADRGSAAEGEWLARLNPLHCLVVALAAGRKAPASRMEDYHTVQNSRTADGKIKETHITHRTYLNDACFAAFLSGPCPVLDPLAAALRDPVWGVWLGRKACIPSAPVFRGMFASTDEAVLAVTGGLVAAALDRVEDVPPGMDEFAAGGDTIPDQPLTFADPRRFAPRRVRRGAAGGAG